MKRWKPVLKEEKVESGTKVQYLLESNAHLDFQNLETQKGFAGECKCTTKSNVHSNFRRCNLAKKVHITFKYIW